MTLCFLQRIAGATLLLFVSTLIHAQNPNPLQSAHEQRSLREAQWVKLDYRGDQTQRPWRYEGKGPWKGEEAYGLGTLGSLGEGVSGLTMMWFPHRSASRSWSIVFFNHGNPEADQVLELRAYYRDDAFHSIDFFRAEQGEDDGVNLMALYMPESEWLLLSESTKIQVKYTISESDKVHLATFGVENAAQSFAEFKAARDQADSQ